MAAQRGISLNKLMEELSIRALAEHDTEMRFRMRAARGNVSKALEILDRVEGNSQQSSITIHNLNFQL